MLRWSTQVLQCCGLLARCCGDRQRLGPGRGGRRQAEADLVAERKLVKKWVQGCRRAAGQALRQLTCRPLRAPPRWFAPHFSRLGLQFCRSGLSDRGLRLRSRPGSGTGAPGSGARGSGGGPGAATASSPFTNFISDSISDSPQPSILDKLQGQRVARGQGSQARCSHPLFPAPPRHRYRKPLVPTQVTLLNATSVAPPPV